MRFGAARSSRRPAAKTLGSGTALTSGAEGEEEGRDDGEEVDDDEEAPCEGADVVFEVSINMGSDNIGH